MNWIRNRIQMIRVTEEEKKQLFPLSKPKYIKMWNVERNENGDIVYAEFTNKCYSDDKYEFAQVLDSNKHIQYYGYRTVVRNLDDQGRVTSFKIEQEYCDTIITNYEYDLNNNCISRITWRYNERIEQRAEYNERIEQRAEYNERNQMTKYKCIDGEWSYVKNWEYDAQGNCVRCWTNDYTYWTPSSSSAMWRAKNLILNTPNLLQESWEC